MADVIAQLKKQLSAEETGQMGALQNHLQKHPEIERVYFNNEGDWIFHKRESFPIEKTRDQVLQENFELKDKEIDAAKGKEPEKTKTTIDANQAKNAALPPYDLTKKYNVKQMTAYVNAATSPEEVNLYVREDNSPEVAEVIKTKLASFEPQKDPNVPIV